MNMVCVPEHIILSIFPILLSIGIYVNILTSFLKWPSPNFPPSFLVKKNYYIVLKKNNKLQINKKILNIVRILKKSTNHTHIIAYHLRLI